MKKTVCVILIILFLSFAAACAEKGGNETPAPAESAAPAASPAAEPTAEPTRAPEPTDVPGPTPVPEPTPVPTDPVGIAAMHGLSADELHGEYDLFMRFCETVDTNAGLGEYRELVYRVFPVIADHTEYLDAEYFFSQLALLEFAEGELDPWQLGQYRGEEKLIVIDPDKLSGDDPELPSVVFHELIHFADDAMNGPRTDMYYLDGEFITPEQYLALPLADRLRAVIPYPSDAVCEGGAELYTAKYFVGSVRWYFNACTFLTGLEHIFGTEELDELFFRSDSNELLCKLFIDAGFSESEYYDACSSLNWLAAPTHYERPDRCFYPEDILIRLYEAELGGGWQTDRFFLYVLKALNGVAWSGYMDTEHAEFLSGIEFETRAQYDEFLESLFGGLPFVPEVVYDPPVPVFFAGRPMLTVFAAWTDETGRRVNGTIAVEYDFEAETPLGYETADMDALAESCFPR